MLFVIFVIAVLAITYKMGAGSQIDHQLEQTIIYPSIPIVFNECLKGMF
jgi:hypothetical protein